MHERLTRATSRDPRPAGPRPAAGPQPLIDWEPPVGPAPPDPGARPDPGSRRAPPDLAARPVPRARHPGRDRQLSLFGVEAAAPAPEDLEGLLAGPGQVVRMGGTARVSVVVQEPWRARVLVREFAARGLAATCVPTADEHIGVRTAYAVTLAPLAAAWLRGAVKLPPRGFGFDGRRLRLWVAAAGTRDELGWTLLLGASDEPAWAPVGSALAAIGLPAELLGPRAGGPAYRITGRRRLYRLAELVGDPPAEAPSDGWPRSLPQRPSATVRQPGREGGEVGHG